MRRILALAATGLLVAAPAQLGAQEPRPSLQNSFRLGTGGNSFTESIYEVKGVPTHVNVKMLGARDITYTADAKIPEVSFQTRTEKLGVLQQHISAKAHQIPKTVHITNTTTPDQTARRIAGIVLRFSAGRPPAARA